MLYGFVQSQFVVEEGSDLLLANVQLSATSDGSKQGAHYDIVIYQINCVYFIIIDKNRYNIANISYHIFT